MSEGEWEKKYSFHHTPGTELKGLKGLQRSQEEYGKLFINICKNSRLIRHKLAIDGNKDTATISNNGNICCCYCGDWGWLERLENFVKNC